VILCNFDAVARDRFKSLLLVVALRSVNKEQEDQLLRSKKFHRCMSLAEAASAITIDGSIIHFFKLFNKNFLEVALEWFVY